MDSKSSIASERDGILQSVGGMACKYDELISKKKDEGREFVKDKRFFYIYHNTVDSVGDDGKTEGHTFEAVRRAIDELAAIVNYIVNSLNGNHVVVTADHGFLFTETARVETDKSKLNDKPESTVLAKKRYLLGPNLSDCDAAWHGKLSVTARATGDMEFWIPKGANLFHFVGGARFVHGGAMPQEIVVPVVTVKQIKGKSALDTKIKPVTVQVLGSNHRITTAQHRFQLIQMEAVSDRVKPITLRIAIYDGEEPVTDIQAVKFESRSGNLDERKKWVSLVLIERQYNKKTPYRLVLWDAENGIEHQSVELIIDRAFTVMHTVATGSSHLGLYRLETQVTAGNGSLKTSGLGSNSAAKEAIKVGFDYFKANASRVSASIKSGGTTTICTLSSFTIQVPRMR